MVKINYHNIEVRMKKIFPIIFMLFALVSPACAIITTEEAISPEVILKHGYSPETARIINYQQASLNNTKQTYYGVQPTRWTTKYKPINCAINYVLDGYVGSDDGLFGKHQIDPSVRWDDL